MRFARRSQPEDQPVTPQPGSTVPAAAPPANPPTDPTPGRLTLLLSTPPWRANPWAHSLPAVLAPHGVQAVHATSARQAERIIRTMQVHLAVVDLSTPMDDTACAAAYDADTASHLEEAGTRILELLSRLRQAPPTVVLKGPQRQRDEHRQVHHALRCNAFAVVDRTAADLETMLAVMHRALNRFYKDRWPNTPPPPNFV
ncbi:MAG: hypothetical protein K2Q09_10785 [Phycisphaerales bacterium]|nr:hypothetical protein [Phycisphaerales bacterium]